MYELIAQYPLFAALFALVGLGVVFGALLGYAAVRFKTEGNPIVDQINEILPQTQCGQCGHPGCRPYAEAIADGEPINKCPPGGQAGVQALADLLDVEAIALDEEHGEESVTQVAYIREDECIGCTKCIQACPVDAILGAAKHMHTVIVSECTGCDLCVEPCPVDCIDMISEKESLQTWSWQLPNPVSREVDIIATDDAAEEAA
ncbi:MAG: electron transport complex subunit RsxB [Halioglobus sp.]|uniref:Ion-translocating oxidoreductase complex subunit B n=1 Tax=Candidatus Seongchinamella marina TaxID=2518990 RepID=A0ABT3SXH6_9GAMM|nr:electron transport complex subunit RsxB [Candidatus Seongchinamella marina]EEB79064.1 electron transport complex, RnfABCDGE type, B subunit subfamily [marine gamma proteobacterium HTCC2148]MBT7718780.1 electron transport complex subunit RsxB [Halieaceae bacterium]MDG1386861.1 electron transport complex subunit RsxB [Halioglobus sp.]MCX2974625.1 electron transport complex subunit RsxB [Candidatus Seongchinamella marina]MDG2327477.1 electron transport complex subunit RsxB [Halioglobus sp.]